jgi:hypothetical protein
METSALYTTADGRTTLPIHFDPVGSVFVIFRQPNTRQSRLVSVQEDGKPLFSDNDSSSTETPVSFEDKIQLTAWQPGSYSATTAEGKMLHAQVTPLPQPLRLVGPWQLSFPPKLGAPEKATFDHLMSWTDSPDDGVKYFSGTATYQQDVIIPAEFFGDGRRLYLDLGEVKNLAEVSVNGMTLGTLWKAPFRVEITDAAKPGPNHLEIKITNLWPNRLIGDSSLPADKRVTWASVSLYKPTSPLLPSGLLGPVEIIPAQRVTLDPVR